MCPPSSSIRDSSETPKTSPRCAPTCARFRDMQFRGVGHSSSAPRAPQNAIFTPARKNHPRISHVPIFGNVGSAHARSAKHPRKHTSHSDRAHRIPRGKTRSMWVRTVAHASRHTPEKRADFQKRPVPQCHCNTRATNPRLLKGPHSTRSPAGAHHAEATSVNPPSRTAPRPNHPAATPRSPPPRAGRSGSSLRSAPAPTAP